MIATFGFSKYLKTLQNDKSISNQRRMEIKKDALKLFNSAKNAIETFPQDVRLKAVRTLVEKSMVSFKENHSEKALQIKCKAGCGGCCHQDVTTTEDELSELSLQLNKSHKPKANECIFLGAGDNCSVYESRPLICRLLMVTSEPKHCMTNDGHETQLMAIEPEIIVSAYWNVSKTKKLGSLLEN